jgi:hypothetical protein
MGKKTYDNKKPADLVYGDDFGNSWLVDHVTPNGDEVVVTLQGGYELHVPSNRMVKVVHQSHYYLQRQNYNRI